MAVKRYSIVFSSNNQETTKSTCTEYSLTKLVEKFIEEDAKILCIVRHPEPLKDKKQLDLDKVKKNKFYNSKYSNYLKRYKNGKITEKEYIEIKEVLKELKNECKDKAEFEAKFQEYLNRKRH